MESLIKFIEPFAWLYAIASIIVFCVALVIVITIFRRILKD